ncbi:MAGE domain-containing protein [Aspergillus vadensis CBS 113365]|uniref:MAGE-domain-containing protein n=1 Tax=Aspergillus vadensis (strain CBS 113365 / IMI 142717 / IBT 24658) TaxID=1448311 RepID=A0A319BFJ7_ASPVC|nr:MAGE-domain-containing protein [Aspergillus vadensis CBS 113365]PYH71515.1 MAGE-domain-containing protein [Aspergillus vadensis CBS 113365]
MAPARKRRAVPDSPSEEDDVPTPATQRRRVAAAHSEDEDDSDADGDGDDAYDTRAPSSTDVMVKKMVRLALASEFSRLPIRRSDISVKVLGEQGTRQFKMVFEEAQRVLQEKFGMEMMELPVKEKVTVQQRRAAQKVEKPSSTNKSWIVTTTLPTKYRKPEILLPSRAPMESTYTGLYSFIIAVIVLNGGTIHEQKLERYLKRTNTDAWTPIDRTDRFLQRLCKEGYLVRNRDVDGGEEVVEYILGPRGKIEVGTKGVARLVREVYGQSEGSERDDEFEIRLARSLGLKQPEPRAQEEQAEEGGGDGEEEGGRQRQRREQPSRRVNRRLPESEAEEESEEEESDG